MNADTNTPTATLISPALRLDPKRGSLAMVASLTCFTANAMLLKHFSASHIDAWVSMTFRFGIGLFVTWIIFVPNIRRSFTSWLLASRGVLGGLGTAAYYKSIGPLGVGKATLIGNTWTIFAAIIAVFALKEKLTLNRFIGIALALTGLALLMEIQHAGFGVDLQWELISLGGAILAAAVVVVIRQLTRTDNSATIFASQCVYGLLIAAPFAAAQVTVLSWADVGLLTLAALCASAGQLAMTEGFRYLTVAAGGAFQVMVPLIISLGGVVFFDEHFTLFQMCGAALILGGSFVAVRR